MNRNELKELFFYFLKLGATGFGGPIAILASIQKDLVHDKKWIDQEEYNQALAMIKAMPGPIGFMMPVFIGRHRAGFWGGVFAGIGYVVPAFIMMLILGVFYDQAIKYQSVKTFFIGVQASAVALILLGLKGLISGNSKNFWFWVIAGVAAVTMYFKYIPEPLIILGAGLVWVIVKRGSAQRLGLSAMAPLYLFSDEISELFVTCFKAGALVFGTGLAIVPLLESDFVERLSWLSHGEFLEALSFGQMTPGPVVITVTFIGYKISGFFGAVAATTGIFLPSFIHMMTWFPLMLKKMSKQKWIKEFVFGSTAAVVGAILAVIFQMTSYWGGQASQYLILMISIALLIKTKTPSWLVLVLGGLVGILF